MRMKIIEVLHNVMIELNFSSPLWSGAAASAWLSSHPKTAWDAGTAVQHIDST